MKKIIAFAIGTLAVLGIAIGVQAGASGGHADQDKQPAVSTPEATTGGSDGSQKEQDGQRDGYTQDHAGKPGENK